MAAEFARIYTKKIMYNMHRKIVYIMAALPIDIH